MFSRFQRIVLLFFLLLFTLVSFIPVILYIPQEYYRPPIKDEENLRRVINDWTHYEGFGLPIEILGELPYLPQIKKDLKFFASGITLDMVKKAYELGCAIRLQFINRTLYSYPILETHRAHYGNAMCNERWIIAESAP